MTLLPEQCRAARALLGWTQRQLAEAAEVGISTVASFEARTGTPIRANLRAIRSALERAGVEVIDENGGGPGVRLHRRRG
jgi:transcriptional regulator with XRE-family HTH domain